MIVYVNKYFSLTSKPGEHKSHSPEVWTGRFGEDNWLPIFRRYLIGVYWFERNHIIPWFIDPTVESGGASEQKMAMAILVSLSVDGVDINYFSPSISSDPMMRAKQRGINNKLYSFAMFIVGNFPRILRGIQLFAFTRYNVWGQVNWFMLFYRLSVPNLSYQNKVYSRKTK